MLLRDVDAWEGGNDPGLSLRRERGKLLPRKRGNFLAGASPKELNQRGS
ncbi:hypothetical protein BLL52_4224 [Rhodoferax antarcticus ANT.BR]|uniref:Uncharacterized protein n=1 Tax=Rhodoferax antarcticus ANT.BR TaxID=1111071 RepID=A0A1Q8Y9E7_9BURK|nr:hypothetical protein BLL52_4224 [Rhodoferax antarcticus ANT.BR]